MYRSLLHGSHPKSDYNNLKCEKTKAYNKQLWNKLVVINGGLDIVHAFLLGGLVDGCLNNNLIVIFAQKWMKWTDMCVTTYKAPA